MIQIDESKLVRLAGVQAFGPGLHCFEEGCVRDVLTTETTTNALVQDARRHTVRLRHTHRMMEGECTCDASDGIEFCQHCVAVALHLQAQQMPAKPVDKRGALRQIRRYLCALSHEDLLDEFLDAIKRFNADFELTDYADDFPELSRDMLIDLHRAAIKRLTWTPSELASYLVDRGAAEDWQPFGSLAMLYREDLWVAFHEAAVVEIESRRSALNSIATHGIDQGQMHELLAELMESFSAGYDR